MWGKWVSERKHLGATRALCKLCEVDELARLRMLGANASTHRLGGVSERLGRLARAAVEEQTRKLRLLVRELRGARGEDLAEALEGGGRVSRGGCEIVSFARLECELIAQLGA